MLQTFTMNILEYFYKLTKQMLTIIVSYLLLINVSECSDQKQKGTWVSNTNRSNLLQSYLNVNNGPVKFTYAFLHTGLSYLYLQDQDGANSVQMRFQMGFVKRNNQPQNFSQTLVDITFYRKTIFNLFNSAIQTKEDVPFNIIYAYRKNIKLHFEQNSYTVSLIDIQRMNPQICTTLLGFVFLVALQFIVLSNKILRLSQVKIYKIMGEYSIQIILLWCAKCMLSVWDQLYYLQYSGGVWLLSILIFCIFLGLFFLYPALTTLKINEDKQIQNQQGIIIIWIYWIGFLLEVFQILEIRLWYILLIINIYQFKQITKVRYVQNIVSNQQTIAFMLFYLIPIAIFPYFAEEANYPKEEAQHWYFYAILCIFQVALFYVSLNGGAALFKRLQLCFKKRVNRNKYEKLQQNICPICVEEVETIEIDMDSAGQIIESKCIKNECNHYFHKTCIKDNKNTINQCFFDGKKYSQELKAIRSQI